MAVQNPRIYTNVSESVDVLALLLVGAEGIFMFV